MLLRRAFVAQAGFAVTAAGLQRAARANARQVLFAQPTLFGGIAPNFSVTGVRPAFNPVGQFYLHANQPNAHSADGDFVPVTWDAGAMTGLHIPANRRRYQRGVWVDGPGSGPRHTVAQVFGDTVGAYLDSRDLKHGSPGNRMMISPGYEFADGSSPFTEHGSEVGVSLDLQVPAASCEPDKGKSNSFAKIDILFVCRRTGIRLSYSCGLFTNGGYPKHDGVGYDDLSHTVIIAAQVSPVGDLVTIEPGSATLLSAPWTGWATFSFRISRAQFARGLVAAAPLAHDLGHALPLDPAEYSLKSTHLNAELHYDRGAPATPGLVDAPAASECSSPEGRRDGGCYQQVYPPSASTMLPVSRLAASEARNSTTEAISSGWPTRFIGVISIHTSAMDLSSMPNLVSGVSM